MFERKNVPGVRWYHILSTFYIVLSLAVLCLVYNGGSSIFHNMFLYKQHYKFPVTLYGPTH